MRKVRESIFESIGIAQKDGPGATKHFYYLNVVLYLLPSSLLLKIIRYPGTIMYAAQQSQQSFKGEVEKFNGIILLSEVSEVNKKVSMTKGQKNL